MSKKDYFKFQTSQELVDTGILYNARGGVALNLDGDPRLQRIVSDVEKYISNNSLKLPQDEKLICEQAIKLIHSPKYYGEYSNSTEKSLSELAVIRMNIKELEKDSGLPNAEMLKISDRLYSEQFKQQDKFYEDYQKRGGNELKNYKPGSLVCREEAAVASFVLHKLGIKNKIVYDTLGDMDTDHAFIQTEDTKAIIETTDANQSYRKVVNNAQAEKAVAITEQGDYYGNRNLNIVDIFKAVLGNNHSEIIEHDQQKALRSYMSEAEKQYRKNLKGHLSFNDISVEGLAKHIDGFESRMDKSKKVLFFGEGKDGEANFDEIVSALKDRGCEISQQSLDKIKSRGVTRYSFPKSLSNMDVAELDKNNNGRLTSKEIMSSLSSHEIKIAEQYGVDIAVFCHVHDLSAIVEIKSR